MLSQQFSRTENRIVGALKRLNDFLMNPLLQVHSGTAPETSGNALNTNQVTNEDDSQNDPHPEAGIFHNQMTQNSRPEDGHDMVTGVHEEVTHCSPDISQTSLNFHNQLTEDDRINYLHSFMRVDSLQTFKNLNGPTQENLGEFLAVFQRKYVKPQSMVTAKLKFQKLVFNPANQKLVDFLDERQELAKDAFGVAAHAIIEQFIYSKMPPHLKKSMNQAHFESGTYEQSVTHLEKELELTGLKAPDEQDINAVSRQPQILMLTDPSPHATTVKKPGHYKKQCRLLEKQREQTENNQKAWKQKQLRQ